MAHDNNGMTVVEQAQILDLRYVEDFGRYEAKVLLQLRKADGAPMNVGVLTSLARQKGEPAENFRRRLICDAARLWRLMEVNRRVGPGPDRPKPAAKLAA